MMTIEEMRKRKRQLGYTNAQLSNMTDIPLGTLNKILSGASKKAAVISWVADWVKRHNIEVTAEQIDQLIESAVYAVKRARECKRDDGEAPSV